MCTNTRSPSSGMESKQDFHMQNESKIVKKVFEIEHLK